ncbi:YhjK family protein [Buttiauxella ferragutiae ATCC 51602]|uniref:YhjK family protein n=1 Tax=Buttiauxella ferragutiae ATCC 51602 TaxID=1354252 RepID=A0ABX2WBM4_9ENTR|nr:MULTISPECIES: biofilm formation regulator HmsP [Buttiauxella]AYN28334.1 biofilm formation regulator HmsP [Buttiauxella sp. 3AFRM03]MCE0827497.1 biofilm formation regulator HmsP [Buttiauxella ferragutiae]OAT30496.1 YhjK family protein [Buttiauxella ferragutiae ATCC 51602]TDN49003.1 diguanylate cyclase/phosphodiesterase [Buttiauxella sp. JUb87]UNK61470.1 biofilm formation regulator HmsP [Buttiauxella ferragutiae]
MRVSRSLTIKQMAMVSAVALLFIFIFIVVQLFHFVQQSRYDTASQMEKIAHSVRIPLSEAILKADIPQAEYILSQIQPSGIISRADVVLPNQFQALRQRFTPERPIPVWIARLFELPVQISLPLYSLERPANPQPLAYLVLQADSWRMYKFIISTISTLLTTYLLLALILSVAISWSINRLIVHPLRKIARELDSLTPHDAANHQLNLPPLHHDDEIGMLVRSYNRNQQMSQRLHEEMSAMSTRNTVTELPNKALLLALLEQLTASDNKNALIVIASETLQDTAGVLNEEQREMLLLTLVEKIKGVLPPNMVLAQLSGNDFGIIAHGVQDAWQAMALAKQILAVLNEKLPIHSISLKPTASIGIAMYHGGLTAEQLYRRAVSAAFSARRHGKNQIQFFDPEQMAIAQRYLTQEQDLLTALENQQFAIWLQPQVNLRTREVVSAEVLLRMQQPDGSWGLPEGLIERIEDSGLMFTIGNWILEESCRVLAGWQSQGVTMPLCVNISAHQLLHEEMGSSLLELMARYRIQPGMLILEVTESHNIDDPKKAVSILRPLRKAGVRIALDDFGMGYASLRHLHHLKSLPVDVLKLDKSFVDGLPEDNTMAGVIIGMANTLGLKLVAEGIENQAQCDWLLNAGVSIAQGYLFSRALTLKEFDARYLSSANQ